MSTQQNPYQPQPRLIDQPHRLETLYCERGLTVREIAENHASVTKTPVYEALREHSILNDTEDNNENHSNGYDPPSDDDTSGIDWSNAH